jgi:hypothetical protein
LDLLGLANSPDTVGKIERIRIGDSWYRIDLLPIYSFLPTRF